MPRKLTGFERMWNAYPAPKSEAEEAKSIIGGNVNQPWLTNSCVVRISRSLNYAGYPIPSGFTGLSTVSGADGMRYAYRVEELRKYLVFAYGPPVASEERAPPRPGVPASFAGKTGIILFRVDGWVDATGHIDLWDGEHTRHAEYFARAHFLALWAVAKSGDERMDPGAAPVPIAASVGKGGVNNPEDVARVQSLLTARGFDVGPADGLLSTAMLVALSDLQSRFLKEPDGRVEPNGRTWRELNGM
jgi:Type VI secretion system (T6SS), amidase effector protein 4